MAETSQISEKRQCPECKSYKTKKFGFRITRKGKKQQFQCSECGHVFT